MNNKEYKEDCLEILKAMHEHNMFLVKSNHRLMLLAVGAIIFSIAISTFVNLMLARQ